MVEKIKLLKPVKINGKEVTELTYDIDAVTADDMVNAEAELNTANMSNGKTSSALPETSPAYQFYYAARAIIACNPDIDIEDLKRVSAKDFIKIKRIGQDFFTDTAEEEESETPSMENQSGELSDNTAEFMEKAPSLLDDSE